MGLTFFGVLGLFQLAFIAHGQYLSSVGSLYAVILVPIAVTAALTFSTMVFYEGLAQRGRTASIRRSHGKGRARAAAKPFWKTTAFVAVAATCVTFFLLYAATFALAVEHLGTMAAFVMAENVGGIGALLLASFFESQYAPKIRTF
ncbi:MAG: hypothetical protein Kow0069_02760 [Promethearchaeota archaeon]